MPDPAKPQRGGTRKGAGRKARVWLKGKVSEIGNATAGRSREWARAIPDRWADGEPMPDIAVRSAVDALGFDLESLKASRRVAV